MANFRAQDTMVNAQQPGLDVNRPLKTGTFTAKALESMGNIVEKIGATGEVDPSPIYNTHYENYLKSHQALVNTEGFTNQDVGDLNRSSILSLRKDLTAAGVGFKDQKALVASFREDAAKDSNITYTQENGYVKEVNQADGTITWRLNKPDEYLANLEYDFVKSLGDSALLVYEQMSPQKQREYVSEEVEKIEERRSTNEELSKKVAQLQTKETDQKLLKFKTQKQFLGVQNSIFNSVQAEIELLTQDKTKTPQDIEEEIKSITTIPYLRNKYVDSVGSALLTGRSEEELFAGISDISAIYDVETIRAMTTDYDELSEENIGLKLLLENRSQRVLKDIPPGMFNNMTIMKQYEGLSLDLIMWDATRSPRDPDSVVVSHLANSRTFISKEIAPLYNAFSSAEKTPEAIADRDKLVGILVTNMAKMRNGALTSMDLPFTDIVRAMEAIKQYSGYQSLPQEDRDLLEKHYEATRAYYITKAKELNIKDPQKALDVLTDKFSGRAVIEELPVATKDK